MKIGLLRVNLFSRSLSCNIDETPSKEGVRFNRLGSESISSCALAAEKGRAGRFQQRFCDGHRAYGFVCDDGSVVSYIWVTGLDELPRVTPFEGGLSLRLPEGDVYIWDCRTEPAYEGRGLYRAGLRALAGTGVSSGKNRVWVVSRVENTRSCRAIESAGFQVVGRMTILCIGRQLLVHFRSRWFFAAKGQIINLLELN